MSFFILIFFFPTSTTQLTLVCSSCNYRLRLCSFLLCDIHLFYTFDYFIQSTGWKNSHDNLLFARSSPSLTSFLPIIQRIVATFSLVAFSFATSYAFHSLECGASRFFIRLLLVLPLLLCPMHILFTSMISDEMNLYDAHSLRFYLSLSLFSRLLFAGSGSNA